MMFATIIISSSIVVIVIIVTTTSTLRGALGRTSPLRYFRARMLSGPHSCFQCSPMYVTEPLHAEWAYAAVLNTVRLLKESVWERICLRRLSPLVLRGARGLLKRSKVQTIVYTSGP
jgi:hypothetical protein